MRVLVLGGSGFIGSAIVRRLRKKDIETAVLDILKPNTSQKANGVRYYQADIRNKTVLRKVLLEFKPTHVIHNASKNAMRLEPADGPIAHDQVLGSGLIQAMSECGARKLIYASSAAVYGNIEPTSLADETWPLVCCSLYAREKVDFERFLVTTKAQHPQLEIVVFRYANVYGPGQKDGVVPIFMSRIFNNQPVQIYGREYAGDKGCLRDFVFVDDVVDANMIALTSDLQGTFNVSSGHAVAIADLLEAIKNQFEGAIDVVHEEPRPLEIKSSALDSRSIALHGWRSTVSLQDGLAKVLGATARGVASLVR